MGLMTAAIVGMGVMQAGSQVAAGYAASSEAKYNAKIKEQQSSMIGAAQGMAGYQADRQIGRAASTLTARVGKSGVMMSGSPMAALIDMSTQMELDKSIESYNYEYQKRFATSQAEAYKRGAKTALVQGYTGAFSTLLQTGAYLGMNNMVPTGRYVSTSQGQNTLVAPNNYYASRAGRL